MTALDWLRKMYKEGCINADFYIRDAAHWSTEIKNGRAGVLVRYVDEGRRAQVAFEHDGLDWQIGLLGAIEGYDGKKGLWPPPATTASLLSPRLPPLWRMCVNAWTFWTSSMIRR